MNANREARAPTSSSVSPDRLRVSWYGVGLLVFERRPFARSLLKRYLPAILIGYPVFLTLGFYLQWGWLSHWLQLWTPVVDVLRGIFPIFDRYERLLLAGGDGDSVAAFHHMLALGWLVGIPMLVFLFVTVLRLGRDEWMGIVTGVPHHLLFFYFLISTIFFLYAMHWAISGPNTLSRYDDSLIGVAAMFGAIVIFGLGAEISIGAPSSWVSGSISRKETATITRMERNEIRVWNSQ